MAGIAPLAGAAAGGSGPLSRLGRAQYGALAEMRWRMLVNSVRSVQGAFELGARGFAFLFYAVMGIGLGTGLGIGAYASIVSGKLQGLSLLFWGVFLVWQVLPIALASFQEQFDLSGLLRFPVSFSSFFLLNLVFGLVDIPAVLGGLCCLGMLIGVTLARPGEFLWALLVLAVFAFFNVLLARAILAWIDRWLSQRKTREIVSAIFLLLMLSGQLLNPALYRQGHRHGPRVPGQQTARQHHGPQVPAWTRTTLAVMAWLPPGLAGEELIRVTEEQTGVAAESLGLMALYIFATAGVLAIRLRAEFSGENLGDAPARRKEKEAAGKWLLDGSGPVAAIFEKELRTIPRAMPLMFALGAPLLTVLVIGTVIRNSSPTGAPPFQLAFPLCVAYTLLGFTQMIYNTLGAEGQAIQILFLSPTPIRKVLLAKNLFHALLFVSVAMLAAIFASFRLGLPSGTLLAATVAWLLFALPANLAAGNVLSLTMPYRLNLGKMSRQRGSQASALISMLVQLGVMAVGVSVFEICTYMRRDWLATPVLLVFAMIMVGVWMQVLHQSESIANRNKDTLITTLAKTQ